MMIGVQILAAILIAYWYINKRKEKDAFIEEEKKKWNAIKALSDLTKD